MFPSGSLGNLMHLHNCATRYGTIKCVMEWYLAPCIFTLDTR